jgi:hypothetical protein
LRAFVKKANANATLMDGSDDTVMKIIAENDVVWGVWQDATQRDGVGLHLIKGRHALKITPANSLQTIRVSAIPCAGYGVSVIRVFGTESRSFKGGSGSSGC